MTTGRRRVVIGVGNEYRRDDGFGPAVVERLRESSLPADVTLAVSDGEPARMLELWYGAELAVVVDAVRTGAARGGQVFEVVADELAGPVATGAGADTGAAAGHDAGAAAGPGAVAGAGAGHGAAGTHRISLGSTVELARVLGRMPRRLVVYAVDGRDFGFGPGLTPEVAAAVDSVARRVRDALR